jgi:hypothetical protein
MKDGLEIKRIGTSKLDNALHVKYHDSMYGFVIEFDLPKLGIPEELKNEWKESIDTEKENNLEAQASVNSELLVKKNEERDRLLKYIFGVVRNGLLSPDKEKSNAAMRLNVVMNPYVGIRKESFDRVTSHVDGLLTDLKKTENAADVSKLGFTSDVTKLETLNKEFDSINSDRAKKRADNKLPKMPAVRNRTDAIFERILLVLQYKYVYGTTPIEPELIAKLIARFNKRAEDIYASYKQGQAIKKAAAEKRKQNPNAPKEPKKPKEPKPKKPEKDNKDPDIHLPETEEPKKPDQPKKPEGGGTPGGGEKPKQPEAGGGEGGNPDIHLPEE